MGKFLKSTTYSQEEIRVLRLVVDNQAVDYLSLLIDFIKEKDLLVPILDLWAHPARPLTFESPHGDINRFTLDYHKTIVTNTAS